MNNPAIHNYHTFKLEKERLQTLFKSQREVVLQDIAALKDEVEPVGELLNVAKMLTRRDKTLGLIGKGMDAIIDFLVRKIIFRKAGWLTKFLASFIAKNVASQFAGKKTKEEYPELAKVLKKT